MIFGSNRWAKYHRTPNRFINLLGIHLTPTGGYNSKRDLSTLKYSELRRRINLLRSFKTSLEKYSDYACHGWISDIDFDVDVRHQSFYISVIIKESISFPEFNNDLNNKLTMEFVRENYDQLYFISDKAISKYEKYIWKSMRNSIRHVWMLLEKKIRSINIKFIAELIWEGIKAIKYLYF